MARLQPLSIEAQHHVLRRLALHARQPCRLSPAQAAHGGDEPLRVAVLVAAEHASRRAVQPGHRHPAGARAAMPVASVAVSATVLATAGPSCARADLALLIRNVVRQT
jgi:hypothetical protein